MLLRTEKMLLRQKNETKGISKSGTEYLKKTLYFKDETGLLYEIGFVNDYIYDNCEENKFYILEYSIDRKGNVEINDILNVKG